MGRFTDDGWESGRDLIMGVCDWCDEDFETDSLPNGLNAALCANCLDHLCTQCGDARAVGLDHQFAPMQMCQGCLDSAFEEASQAQQEPVSPVCEHCGFEREAHKELIGMIGIARICPTSVWRAR